MQDSLRESEANRVAPVVSIVGHSGSGKTTLLERLIRELKRRGYRIAVIKHHHHPGLQFDAPGKDSWRFAEAGAEEVVLAGPREVVHLRYPEEEPRLENVAAMIQDVDLILTEGYKHGGAPKIAVSRGETGPGSILDVDELVAVASDRRVNLDIPQFDLDDVAGLATWMEGRFLS